MSTEITVRGSFEAFEAPERGIVHACLEAEGPHMPPVYEQVAGALDAVKASIAPLYNPDAGPVTWWAAQQLRTWSHRPPNKDGKQLPLVHHARVTLEVKFRDFTALSRWVAEHITATAGFRLARVEWALTAARREQLLREVRSRAVRDAAQRAQQYSDALDLGPVHPVAIADAGMLGNLAPEGGPAGYLRAAGAPPGGAPEVALVPEDIEVSARVDARFRVGAECARHAVPEA